MLLFISLLSMTKTKSHSFTRVVSQWSHNGEVSLKTLFPTNASRFVYLQLLQWMKLDTSKCDKVRYKENGAITCFGMLIIQLMYSVHWSS